MARTLSQKGNAHFSPQYLACPHIRNAGFSPWLALEPFFYQIKVLKYTHHLFRAILLLACMLSLPPSKYFMSSRWADKQMLTWQHCCMRSQALRTSHTAFLCAQRGKTKGKPNNCHLPQSHTQHPYKVQGNALKQLNSYMTYLKATTKVSHPLRSHSCNTEQSFQYAIRITETTVPASSAACLPGMHSVQGCIMIGSEVCLRTT